MTIRVVIADDEPIARAKLRRLLAMEPDFAMVAECEDGRAAVAAIERHRPDVVFLDIQMPALDGIDAIASLPESEHPIVIFVTAYDTHALRAFEVQASDYLLKPFDAARFRRILDRIRRQHDLELRPDAAAVRAVLDSNDTAAREADPVPGSGRYPDRLELRSIGHIDWIAVADIEWIEATGNYVRLYTPTGSALLREPLTRLVSRLDPASFVRIHRRAAVNLNVVRRMSPRNSGDHLLILRTGVRLRVSRTFRSSVLARLASRI